MYKFLAFAIQGGNLRFLIMIDTALIRVVRGIRDL